LFVIHEFLIIKMWDILWSFIHFRQQINNGNWLMQSHICTAWLYHHFVWTAMFLLNPALFFLPFRYPFIFVHNVDFVITIT
jgi:hypothetical protein